MKFLNCPAHSLHKVGIPTLSKSIPTLRTEFISSLLPLYNSRIVRYNSRIGGQSENTYFAQVQFRNCTDSYFAQNIYMIKCPSLVVYLITILKTSSETILPNNKFYVEPQKREDLTIIISILVHFPLAY